MRIDEIKNEYSKEWWQGKKDSGKSTEIRYN
jgi:hypothetical protein